MRVTFYGVRGTNSVTRPDFEQYGEETTSILVEGEGGERIAIDAGTGLRDLGWKLKGQGTDGVEFLLLMTHYHLDHLIGLPTFAPLYQKRTRLTIAAPRRKGRTPETVISQIFSSPFWPVQIEMTPAQVDFLTLGASSAAAPFTHGGLQITWGPLHHPGGSTAYRFDEPATGGSFVLATDVEWGESTPAERKAFIRLCGNPAPPDLLAFDGQYGIEEYPRFRGWGHSTREDAAELARLVGAKKLLVIHHDPEKNDRDLAAAEAKLIQDLPSARLARQGTVVRLGKKPAEKKREKGS